MRLEKELGCLARDLDGGVEVQSEDAECAWRGWGGGEGLGAERVRDLEWRVSEAGREAERRREEAEGLGDRIKEMWAEMEMFDDEEVSHGYPSEPQPSPTSTETPNPPATGHAHSTRNPINFRWMKRYVGGSLG